MWSPLIDSVHNIYVNPTRLCFLKVRQACSPVQILAKKIEWSIYMSNFVCCVSHVSYLSHFSLHAYFALRPYILRTLTSWWKWQLTQNLWWISGTGKTSLLVSLLLKRWVTNSLWEILVVLLFVELGSQFRSVFSRLMCIGNLLIHMNYSLQDEESFIACGFHWFPTEKKNHSEFISVRIRKRHACCIWRKWTIVGKSFLTCKR